MNLVFKPGGIACQILLLLTFTSFLGCADDTDQVRAIQAKRQQRLQTTTKQDHLGDAFDLMSQFVTLNLAKAKQQIAYHLNEWRKSRANQESPGAVPKLVGTLDEWLLEQDKTKRIIDPSFQPDDVLHLRDCFLFSKINAWVNSELRDDIVLKDWIHAQEKELGEDTGDQLRTASRLFDWTVRNIAIEPSNIPAPPGLELPELPEGLKFEGAGYRQSDYQTVTRGTGDAWQRAGVFTKLCQQANIDSAILATQSTDTGELSPWCVGVFIGEEVYLFEPELGIHVPGPDQIGIATLKQARTNDAVMRRLSVPGFFDYPLSKGDVQQSVALLNLVPEAVSDRMKSLEGGLTGDRRMNVYEDVDELAEHLDEYSGIGGVRMWKVPLQAEVYRSELEKFADRNPRFLFWYVSAWAILESGVGNASELATARWMHLLGDFADNDEEIESGARTIYLKQRNPEYEIADLDIDVELQKAYGIRRDLGVSSAEYKAQIDQIQLLMRMGKRTATYWLALLQYDDGEMETADYWFGEKVLDKNQLSHWAPAARYNLGRTLELMGQFDKAIEVYKTDGDPQEHGNRIRSRLVSKLTAGS